MPISTTSGRSWAARAIGSRRSAASAIGSTMPDGIPITTEADPADRQALTEDARLIRGVRWRLVAWSGLTTLLVLAILGVALYLSAARTLAENGVSQLNLRASQIVDTLEHP